MSQLYNLPNLLTFSRIALIPFFVLFFYLPVEWGMAAATAVFVLAGFTDWLDGYLARRLEQTSAFGAFLDPVADKLMVAVALVLIVESDKTIFSVPIALSAAIIIGREITISALREWMAELGARGTVAVSVVGKFKTIAQIVALILMLYKLPVAGVSTYAVGLAFLVLAAGLTMWSMFVYLRSAWPVLTGPDSGG